MSYVDGYIIPVPTKNKEAYREMAKIAAPIFKEHGATRVVECWGEDVPTGKITSFPLAVNLEPEETVVFSWVTWPSKAIREEGIKKVMEDPRLAPYENKMPFDGKRMIFGGFETLLEE